MRMYRGMEECANIKDFHFTHFALYCVSTHSVMGFFLFVPNTYSVFKIALKEIPNTLESSRTAILLFSYTTSYTRSTF